jgi:hypothetical protein
LTVTVFIVPEVRRSFAADEFGDRIFANHPVFPPSALVAEVELLDTVFSSVATFGLDRLVESAFADVSLFDTVFSNVPTFGADTLVENPPDEILLDAVFNATATFGADTLSENPPDEILRDTVFSNVATFGADTLEEAVGGEDDDAVIGGAPIGVVPA